VIGGPDPPGPDSLGLWDALLGLPTQVAEAATAAEGLPALPRREQVEHVVVLGVGGSGDAGDIAAAVAAPFLPVPITVVKDYEPPEYVGAGTLVFALSWSGSTEETVEAATAAYESGAFLVVVAGEGTLLESAREWRVPWVPVPSALPGSRPAVGALVVPVLVVLDQVGLYRGASHWIAEAVAQLRRRRDELVVRGGIAESVARRIGRTIPLIHGVHDLGATASRRWKAVVNQYAKTPAFSNAYPELCHDEVAGWGQCGDVTRQVITLVSLRHDGEHPQAALHVDEVVEELREVVADTVSVRAGGEGALAQLLDLVMVGDAVALHLAAAAGIDPGPTPMIEALRLPSGG